MQRKTKRLGRAKPVPLEPGTLPINILVEMLCAAHLSSYVDSPFPDRGGLFIVGPPSVLKSTLLEMLDHHYHDAVTVSDINARSLGDLRDQIAAKVIRTLVIPEYAKLHERHPYTAANVEATLRALVGEGFSAPSFEDARINRLRARVTMLSGMVPKFQVDHFRAWEDSGFNRRFLWCLVRLKDQELLERAVEEWARVDFKIRHIPIAPDGDVPIPQLTTKAERAELRTLIKYQPGGSHTIQLALLVKMLAVLKWWYGMIRRPTREAMVNLRLFSQCLGKEGAELVI